MNPRNKYVIGVNGVDNTGKSTLVSLLSKHINELDGGIVYTPPHFSRLSRNFPSEELQAIEWLKKVYVENL